MHSMYSASVCLIVNIFIRCCLTPATSIGAICVLFVYISRFLSQVSVVRSALQKLMTNHIRGTLLDACLQFSPEWMQLPWEWALDRGL